MSSLVDQVDHLFAQHRWIGQSRKAWRDDHPGFGRMAPGTFSWASEKRYKHAAIQGVTWINEHDHIREIAQITPDMIEAYIAARRAAGLSPNTVATDLTALRRLGQYAVMEGWLAASFVPADLRVPREHNPRYSYAPTAAAAIIEQVAGRNPLAGLVLTWQNRIGLRIDEAVMLRRDKIDVDQLTVEVKGKGGKTRVVPIPDRAMLDQLPQPGRLNPLLRGRRDNWIRLIEGLVAEACQALAIDSLGTHGFRAAYAQRTFDDLLAQGKSDRAARKVLAKRLGHNRISVTNDYAP